MVGELRKFSLYALAVVVFIAFGCFFLQVMSAVLLGFLLLAWLIGVLSYAYLLKMSTGRAQRFVNATLSTIGLKMFGSLTILLVFGVLAPKDLILPVVLSFMVAYLALTALEVYFILPFLKSPLPQNHQKTKITVLKVIADKQQCEVLTALLAEEGFDSFLETEQGFEAALDSKDINLQKLNQIISSQGASFSFSEIDDQNWNELWESQISPLEVDSRLYVRAEFHQPNPNFELELIITPKMAFGSGHHQTTYMMTQFVMDSQISDKKVLDAGCGTGILGILAKKLGAQKVICVDIEDWAVQNAIENAQINDQTITVLKGKALQFNENFDFIFANISLNAILAEMKHYSTILNPKGFLVTSGFFVSDIDTLTQEAAKYGFELVEKRNRDNWAAVKYAKIR
jgi:ribosomal protein L11 methyltransferase